MKKILLLEDDEDTLALLNQTLSEHFEVTSFSRGIDAIVEIFKGYRDGFHYDALVLDCALPYFDGFTIARMVRAAEKTEIVNKPVKIGFFTAYPKTVESSSLLEEVRADRYFRKPEEIARLPELIVEWLAPEVAHAGG
jgi:DNA-binding response OmpR family regulator